MGKERENGEGKRKWGNDGPQEARQKEEEHVSMCAL